MTEVPLNLQESFNHPDIDASKIGFAGHSEGGLIAPMVAAKNKEVSFIALLAGRGWMKKCYVRIVLRKK